MRVIPIRTRSLDRDGSICMNAKVWISRSPRTAWVLRISSDLNTIKTAAKAKKKERPGLEKIVVAINDDPEKRSPPVMTELKATKYWVLR